MGDWKDTIFFWRGELTLDAEFSPAKWQFAGSWCGADAPAAPPTGGADLCPDAMAFAAAAAANTFSVTGHVVRPPGAGSAPGPAIYPSQDCIFVQASGRAGGTYTLNNGDGPALFADDEHILVLIATRPPTDSPETNDGGGAGGPFAVVAKGRNEFGPFLALGFADAGMPAADADTTAPFEGVPRGSAVATVAHLTLARRYLTSRDPRVELSHAEIWRLAAPTLAANGPPGPWNSPVLAAKWKRPKPTQAAVSVGTDAAGTAQAAGATGAECIGQHSSDVAAGVTTTKTQPDAKRARVDGV
jgi:hypothetical protein